MKIQKWAKRFSFPTRSACYGDHGWASKKLLHWKFIVGVSLYEERVQVGSGGFINR